jgi:NCS1 family nucleobase:cation symporter-1
METVRRFVDFAGPAIWIAMFVLAIWIAVKAGGSLSFAFSDKNLSTGQQVQEFLAVVSLTVSYFAALLLNFCDFSRFAPTRKAVRLGNLLGLPVNFIAFAAVSAVVTAGTFAVYGEFITDPVEVVARLDSVVVLLIGAVTFAVATLGINVVANFVSAAYDLSNVVPKVLDFRRAGLVAALLALLVMPWKLYGSPVAINYFLGALGAFLGPLFGILMVDYWVIRRERVAVAELYKLDGDYTYRSGVNPRAVVAFVVTAVPTALIALLPGFAALAPFSWPIGVVLGAAVYYPLMRNQPVPGSVPQAPEEHAA